MPDREQFLTFKVYTMGKEYNEGINSTSANDMTSSPQAFYASVTDSPMNGQNLNKIKAMFFSEEKTYQDNIDNLWSTRIMLAMFIESKPEMKQSILPLFETINVLIDALLPEEGPNPPFFDKHPSGN